MSTASKEFLKQAAYKAPDLGHRAKLRWALDQAEIGFTRGKSRMDGRWESARQRAYEVKWEAINHLDQYLLQFEEAVRSRGGHVYWATDGEDARRYIVNLAKQRNVQRIVKSKSMVSEEIHLAEALEHTGADVLETDLGEYIVQLRKEPPYHIVTPAMHLSRTDIADLFREKLGAGDDDTPETLVAIARHTLRDGFVQADMGITGANFLVADVGMAAITENEGNARLSASLPKLHVVLTGIEKIIPKLEHLGLFWPMLATAGGGQSITAYNTLIGGPRQPGETDGPEEFHVVLLDNGRSALLADAEQRDVLHCIRCGACLNVCPIFLSVGGHTYGTTYPGPIGSVLTPHLRGLNDFGHLSFASSLCGACTSVCPVKIDLHHHLLQNRRNAIQETHRPAGERIGFHVWRWFMQSERRYGRMGRMAQRLLRLFQSTQLENTPLDPLRPWTRYRTLPSAPQASFREWWQKNRGIQA